MFNTKKLFSQHTTHNKQQKLGDHIPNTPIPLPPPQIHMSLLLQQQ